MRLAQKNEIQDWSLSCIFSVNFCICFGISRGKSPRICLALQISIESNFTVFICYFNIFFHHKIVFNVIKISYWNLNYWSKIWHLEIVFLYQQKLLNMIFFFNLYFLFNFLRNIFYFCRLSKHFCASHSVLKNYSASVSLIASFGQSLQRERILNGIHSTDSKTLNLSWIYSLNESTILDL